MMLAVLRDRVNQVPALVDGRGCVHGVGAQEERLVFGHHSRTEIVKDTTSMQAVRLGSNLFTRPFKRRAFTA
jgi:hypothetical protein